MALVSLEDLAEAEERGAATCARVAAFVDARGAPGDGQRATEWSAMERLHRTLAWRWRVIASLVALADARSAVGRSGRSEG